VHCVENVACQAGTEVQEKYLTLSPEKHLAHLTNMNPADNRRAGNFGGSAICPLRKSNPEPFVASVAIPFWHLLYERVHGVWI